MKTDYLKIPHNKHLGKKPKDCPVPKYSKGKQDESIIKWQTEEAKEEGTYIVTYKNGEVDFDVFMSVNGWAGILKVIAWCKLSDIEPYKKKEEQP